jgi:hypothetical protein
MSSKCECGAWEGYAHKPGCRWDDSDIPQPPEPGEAAKGGGVTHNEVRAIADASLVAVHRKLLGRYIDQQEAAESERDALQAKVRQFMACADALEDLANGKSHVQCLAARPGETTLECDATNPCLACKTVSRITALEAALAQAEEERERFLVLADHLSSGVLENVPTDRVWSVNVRRNASYLAAMVTRLRNPSPTRSARAEARSDGEGEPCGECGSTDGRCATIGHLGESVRRKPAQPPQPGGFGPTDVGHLSEHLHLRRAQLRFGQFITSEDEDEYVTKNMAVLHDVCMHLLADRLERKP